MKKRQESECVGEDMPDVQDGMTTAERPGVQPGAESASGSEPGSLNINSIAYCSFSDSLPLPLSRLHARPRNSHYSFLSRERRQLQCSGGLGFSVTRQWLKMKA